MENLSIRRFLQAVANETVPFISSSSSDDFAFKSQAEPTTANTIATVIGLLVLLLVVFVGLAVICDEYLAPSLETLASWLQLPHDVACATFLAFGSSAPEICISSVATIRGKVNVSIGTIMGSGIIAYTVIPAACVMVSKGHKLQLEIVPLMRDVTFYCISVVAFIQFAHSGGIGFRENLFMVLFFVLYIFVMMVVRRFYHDPRLEGEEGNTTGLGEMEDQHLIDRGQDTSVYGTSTGIVDTEEFDKDPKTGSAAMKLLNQAGNFAAFPWKMLFRVSVPPLFTDPDSDDANLEKWWPLTMIMSLVWISILSEAVLEIVVSLSDRIGLSHHLAGLTLVALGAQIPDLFGSITVAKQGEGPSSVANAIGSQIIDVLLGMGLPFLIYNLATGQDVFLSTKDKSGSVELTSMLLTGLVIVFLFLCFRGCSLNRLGELTGGKREPHTVLNEDHKPSLSLFDAILLVVLYVSCIVGIVVNDTL